MLAAAIPTVPGIPATAFMAKALQKLPTGLGTSSPPPIPDAIPAAAKLRQGSAAVALGRFFCGHSGSVSAAPAAGGAVRGTHMG